MAQYKPYKFFIPLPFNICHYHTGFICLLSAHFRQILSIYCSLINSTVNFNDATCVVQYLAPGCCFSSPKRPLVFFDLDFCCPVQLICQPAYRYKLLNKIYSNAEAMIFIDLYWSVFGAIFGDETRT